MLDIREVGPERFEEIWPFFREVIAGEDSFPYPADLTKEEGRALWFSPGARVYNAYAEGTIVGSRYLVPNKVGLGNHICNTGVMIALGARGKGYGKQMSVFGIARARELGYRAIQLNLVVETNAASIAINKKNGFKIVGTLPGAFFYKRERYVDAYVMYREL
jgi:RimJ/RimL family protein N-acetyltransferase